MTLFTTALTICLISILGSLFLVKRNRALDQTVYRVLMFGLYFWILVFVQTMISSLVYWLAYK